MTQAPGIGVTSLLFCSFQDLKEKKEVVEETENGRDAPANGNAVSMATICRERQPLCQHLLIFPSLLAFAEILSPAVLRGDPSKWQHGAVQRALKPLGLQVQQMLPSLWAAHVCAERKGWAWIPSPKAV